MIAGIPLKNNNRMNTFPISYQDNTLEVTQRSKHHFSVRLPDRELELELKQDNEGANHWFEAGTDNASEESRNIGVAIETALSEQEAGN